MTVWQSIGQVSAVQWAYAIALAVLFYRHGPTTYAKILAADFSASLVIAGAMDTQIIGQSDGRLFMLVAYVAATAALAFIPGVSRVIALFGAISSAALAGGMFMGLEFSATSAIVNVLSVLQIVVALIGAGGNDSGHGRRSDDNADPVAVSPGDIRLVQVADKAGYYLLSQNRG